MGTTPEEQFAEMMKELLAQIMGRAKNGVVLSQTMTEHFANVVSVMNAIGAKRHGSTSIKDEAGKDCIADIYTLPDGRQLLAGYRDQI